MAQERQSETSDVRDSTTEEPVSSEPRRGWRRLLTVPAIVATTALTGAVSWGVTHFLAETSSSLEARNPIAISLETNPSRIGGASDETIRAILPSGENLTGSPGAGCDGFHPWAMKHGGVDAGTTKLQLIVQGRVPDAVQLSGLRVEVLSASPPLRGVSVECPPAAEAQFRAIAVDLDGNPPRVTYHSSTGNPFGFTLNDGETETFNIVASASQGHYEWILHLDVVVSGQRRTFTIRRDDGKPFETTANNVNGRSWSWDYSGSWLRTDPAGDGHGERVPAGEQLAP